MSEKTSKIEKLEELIKFIHENKCLPKKETNKELFSFYAGLQHRVKKAKEREESGLKLNKAAIENIDYYNQIEEALSCYSEKKNEQVEELIHFINQNQTLPKRNENKELFIFYTGLQQRAKKAKEKQQNGQKLGKIALKNLNYYNQVEQALLCYTQTKVEKIQELVEFIKQNKRLPKSKTHNNNQSEYLYKDETDMYFFYKSFTQTVNNLTKKKKQGYTLTNEELMYLEYNKVMKEELSKYKMPKQEKFEELIEFIKKHHRLPKSKRHNNDQSEILFRDGTDMSYFYLWLNKDANNAIKKQNDNKPLTKIEQENLNYYNKVQEVLSSFEITKEEKVVQLIEFIHKNHCLPKHKFANNKQNQVLYRDGTDMRYFYTSLTQKVYIIKKKINNNESLNKKDLQDLEYFDQVQEALAQNKITKEEKLEQLINFIHENHRLPKSKKYNNGKIEYLYKDKTNMNKFYSSLSRAGKNAIEKEQRGEALTKKEQMDKEGYQKVKLIIAFYTQKEKQENVKTNNSEIDRIMDYLEILRKNNAWSEMMLFCEVIIENKKLSEEEKQNLRAVFQKYIKQINKTKNQSNEELEFLQKKKTL